MKRFPEQLSALRIAKRMSQAELGDILGVSRAAVSEWENGKSVPRLDKLAEISRFFGASLSELSGTPGDDASVDAALRILPEDMQGVLRKSFLDTIAALGPSKKL